MRHGRSERASFTTDATVVNFMNKSNDLICDKGCIIVLEMHRFSDSDNSDGAVLLQQRLQSPAYICSAPRMLIRPYVYNTTRCVDHYCVSNQLLVGTSLPWLMVCSGLPKSIGT